MTENGEIHLKMKHPVMLNLLLDLKVRLMEHQF